jgi:NADH:ubiquinone oxidoreductase subunit 3 (subunit A)
MMMSLNTFRFGGRAVRSEALISANTEVGRERGGMRERRTNMQYECGEKAREGATTDHRWRAFFLLVDFLSVVRSLKNILACRPFCFIVAG